MHLPPFIWLKKHTFRFFRKAIDLNYYLSNAKLRPVDNIHSLRPRSFIYGIGRFIFGFIYEIAWLPYSLVSWVILCIASEKVIFIVNSKNQLEVAESLVQASSKKKLKIVWTNGRPFGGFGHRYPAAFAYVLALFDICNGLLLHGGAKDYLSRAVHSRLDYYWIANAHMRFAKFWLKSSRIRKVVFSNDHIVWTRAIAIAAKNIGLETIYIEHAAVSKFFPPLIWSKALLGGNKSLEAYKTIREDTKIVCTGMPRFDRIFSMKNAISRKNLHAKPKVFGIAVNPIDDLFIIKEIIALLINNNMDVIVRTHPRDNRAIHIKEEAIRFVSFDRSPTSAEYFKNIEVLIGGDSTILLEAALYGIPVAYCRRLGLGTDYYDFVREGICFDFSFEKNFQEELERLIRYVPDTDSLKNYYAPFGTRYAGRAAQLICQEIFE